jgi:hypothetical protein
VKFLALYELQLRGQVQDSAHTGSFHVSIVLSSALKAGDQKVKPATTLIRYRGFFVTTRFLYNP